MMESATVSSHPTATVLVVLLPGRSTHGSTCIRTTVRGTCTARIIRIQHTALRSSVSEGAPDGRRETGGGSERFSFAIHTPHRRCCGIVRCGLSVAPPYWHSWLLLLLVNSLRQPPFQPLSIFCDTSTFLMSWKSVAPTEKVTLRWRRK